MNYSIYEDAITEDDDTFFEDLGNDFKEALCGAMAVAGIEDVIGTDIREVWTVLGEEEPDGYDYDADEHTDVIERATNFLADELLGTGYVIYLVTLAVWAFWYSQPGKRAKNKFGVQPKK